MASNINRVTLTGNLTRDPEVREAGDTTVCGLRLAVNASKKTPSGSWEDRPNYFDVTVWGAQASACGKFLAKGSKVAIDGRLEWQEWEKDGKKNQTVKVVAQSVEFLSSSNTPAGDTGAAADAAIPF
jgi:single-strand DNA-binding protein